MTTTSARVSMPICPPDRLVFGMHLPIAAQSRAFAQPWEAEAGPEEMRRIAVALDQAGFFYLGVSDHVAVPRDLAPTMSTIWYDPIATLGFLAAATQRIRLLSYVYVLPYRHPLVAAKSFATLDCLSSGRAIVGVGAGHVEREFAALGIDFKRRGKLLDEGLDLLEQALLEEYPSHDGPAYPVRDLGQQPRPLQRPRPPIWVGGSTPAALRRAAERGDGWLPQGVPEMGMAAAIEMIRSHRARARDAAHASIEIGMNAPWMYVGKPSFEVPTGTRTGSADELAEPLRQARALGVQHMGIRLRSRTAAELVEQIDAFARKVMPRAQS